MRDGGLVALTFCAALACGLVSGAFFAFSAFVMKGLARLPPGQGIAAMQSINVTAVTPLFMTALFGTGALCVALAVFSLPAWPRPGAVSVIAGSLLYLLGTILVTIAFNVPRNDALARVDAESEDGARLWTAYLRSWTAWNDVRTIAALTAAALLTAALCLHDGRGAVGG